MSKPNNLHAVPADEQSSASAGPRKLVRPRLAEQGASSRFPPRRAPSALLAHQDAGQGVSCPNPSHAELFYFQKQLQAQTPMVFVLDDGERIEGVIEWYDQHAIKVRHTTRTLIYKGSIKYLFKAVDASARTANTEP